MTKSYTELFKKGTEFLEYLHAHGVNARLDMDSFRDYHVKIRDVFGSTITIYHKPSKQTFSLHIQDHLSDDLQNDIFSLWNAFNANTLFPDQGLCAYVDGSFYNNVVGWGFVIVENGKVIHKDQGIVNFPNAVKSRQISGEIQAVLEVLKYVETEKKTEINIFYDYLGLEKWAKKLWIANTEIAKYYIDILSQSTIAIRWNKVQAHTGNIYNEMADRLAKSAIQNAY